MHCIVQTDIPMFTSWNLLTFIRTHRKSHTKELWGLLGPQDLVLYPCNNRKTIRAISIIILNKHDVSEEYQKYWHLHAKRFEKN